MKILAALARLILYTVSTAFCSLFIFINILVSYELRYPEMMNKAFWDSFLHISIASAILLNYVAYLTTKKFRKNKSA